MTAFPATRQHLLQMRRQLADRLRRIRAGRTRVRAPLPADLADQAVERENDEVLDRLYAATTDDLAQIDAALERIATGHYGTCRDCGATIPRARLRVLPQATTCTACAEEQGKAA